MTQLPNTENILIVDDNVNNLKVLYQALKRAGGKVSIAKDGETAISQVEYRAPALILLDVMMPGIDGFETCKRLKENPKTRDIPVIFMTALSETIDKVKGFSLGAVDYITKPFETEEVLVRVSNHIKLRTLAAQLEEQNQVLEERVAERTAELARSMDDLQQAQVQLVQQEKMATLGQLVAGVAHEINNPVGYIAGNISHAREYIKDLIDMVDLYQKHYPEPVEEIAEAMEDLDLEYLVSDLPELIESMQVGIKRITQISQSMRTFSRSDTVNKVKFNIHDGIDSTLMILKHRLKANQNRPDIEIVKNYGALPEVPCYPGQLNQVFMNLIANAIDALEESNQGKSYEEITANPNQITISTEIVENSQDIAISIKDNGPGMPEEVQRKVFEHLFTTKPPGKGTGLGLSISRRIVNDKHGGKLNCSSQVGVGTEFTIEIPLEWDC